MDKTFHTYRKSKTLNENVFFRWNPFNLVNKHYTRGTNQVYEMLMEKNVPKKIYQSRPSLVLNIGNEYMTFMLMEEFAKYYKNSPLQMPQRHTFTRFARDLKEFSRQYVDYAHFTVPLTTANTNGFVFPGEFVGQYGVYDATKYVYENTPALNGLAKDDHILVNKRYFSSDMEKAIAAIRTQFRVDNQIDEKAYTIFIAPGNEKSEVEFCLDNLRRGVKEFLLKYSAPTSLSEKAPPLENFATILSVEEGSDGQAFVNEYLRENEWYGKVVTVTNEGNKHFDGMCASDFGFVYDGQMVSSANALHLPVNCMINMRMHQQWFNDFYNRWWNDMNIVADNHCNLEIIGGQVWWGKICDTLAENYLNTDARYNMIQKLDGFVQDSMSFKPLDRSVVRTKDLMLDDGQAYDQYYDPFVLAATNMMKDIDAYNL